MRFIMVLMAWLLPVSAMAQGAQRVAHIRGFDILYIEDGKCIVTTRTRNGGTFSINLSDGRDFFVYVYQFPARPTDLPSRFRLGFQLEGGEPQYDRAAYAERPEQNFYGASGAANIRFLPGFGAARTVSILVDRRLVDSADLSEGARALAEAFTCAQPGYRPRIAQAPPSPGMPQPQPSGGGTAGRETVYEATGYAVYREAPGYCTLFIDTTRGSMIRMSLRGSTGEVNFSWVNPGFPQRTEPSLTAMLRFDRANRSVGFGAVPYTSGDGRWGFTFVAEDELLASIAHGTTVDIWLGDSRGTPLETLILAGSGRAINALTSCAGRGDGRQGAAVQPAQPAPTAPGPEPADAQYAFAEAFRSSGRFRTACVAGQPETFVDNVSIGRGGFDCASDADVLITLVGGRQFPSGEIILLILMQPSGVVNSGTVVRIPPGGRPQVIGMDYMSGFDAIRSPTQVSVAVGQVLNLDCGETWSTHELTLDWTRRVVARDRETGRSDRCGGLRRPRPARRR